MSVSSNVGMDLWRYHILGFCDLGSLIRLAWTCSQLRTMLNEPSFVVEWQTSCWYLYRDCLCGRNQFYLQVTPWCSFTYDYTPKMDSQWEARQFLRATGRSPTMLQALRPQQSIRVPSLSDPRKDPERFHEGVMSTWIDTILLPVPRMVNVPVEDTVVQPMTQPRQPYESTEDFQERQYWRNVHDVEKAVLMQQDRERPRRLPTGFSPFGAQHPQERQLFRDFGADAVACYIRNCEAEGRDPYDPLDDPNLEGHEAVQWARRRMYESPLGNQAYPFELCLRRTDMEPPYAHLHGVDYLERMFLSLYTIQPTQSMTDHRGVVYWTGVRYTNEPGDFVNWALAQWATENAVYIHLWYDVCFQFLEMTMRWIRQLALELQDDTSPNTLRQRWLNLEHCLHCRLCREMPQAHQGKSVDPAALQFLCRADYAPYFHRLRHAIVDDRTERRFLETLIPTHMCHRTAHRSEAQLIHDLDETLELLSFITDVGQHLCAPVGPSVSTMRCRTRSIYLGAGVSLVAFCPTWCPQYSWKPSRTDQMDPLGIPRADVTHNHRFRHYLDFMNRRTMYYQSDNETMMQMHAQGQDIAKAMEM